MTQKQLQKKFETEYLYEPKLLNFNGYTLFHKAGRSQREKFVRAMNMIDPDSYLLPIDTDIFEVYWNGKEFNLRNEGEFIGEYCGL